MMSAELIRDIQLTEAARASRDGKVPLAPWDRGDLRMAPFLGEYVPAGWRPLTWDEVSLPKPRGSDWWSGPQAALFVDSSGFANKNEPALGFDEADDFVRLLLDTTTETVGVGILSAGQFQVYVGLYVKDETAPGTPVDEDNGLCATCGGPDGPLDYHECYGAVVDERD